MNAIRYRWLNLTSRVGVVLLFAALVGPITAWPQAVSWTPYELPMLRQTMLASANGSSYRIVVASPAGPAPAAGYPVIYVVDGNAWTGFISEIIRTNMQVGVQSRVEPAVVVGIGYPTSDPFDLTRRTFDFTSIWPSEDRDPTTGTDPTGGDVAMMDFIDSKVKAMIESQFPIDKTRQTLMGHSLGGLFTLSTMFNRPNSYQTYVAMSPSIWWHHRALMNEAQRFVSNREVPKKLRLFLSAGDLEQNLTPEYKRHTRDILRGSFDSATKADSEADKEFREMSGKAMVGNARQLAAMLSDAQIPVKFIDFPDEDHFSVVPAALGRAVPFALGDGLPAR